MYTYSQKKITTKAFFLFGTFCLMLLTAVGWQRTSAFRLILIFFFPLNFWKQDISGSIFWRKKKNRIQVSSRNSCTHENNHYYHYYYYYFKSKVASANLPVWAMAWNLVVNQLLGTRLHSLQHLTHIVVAGSKAVNAWHMDKRATLLDLEIQRSLKGNKGSNA